MEVILIPLDQFKELNNKVDKLLEVKENRAYTGKLLTNVEVANILGVSLRTLQSYRDRGLITFAQHGRKILYQYDDVLAFFEKHKIVSND